MLTRLGVRGLAAGLAGVAGLLPSAAQADILIGPRFAYYFDNSNLRTSSIPAGVQDESLLIDENRLAIVEQAFPGQVSSSAQQDGIGVVADQIAVPMIGAMINFGDDRDRFTISALYGQGSGSFAQTQAVSRSLTIRDVTEVDFGRFIATADFDYDRYDIEATWQRRTSESFAFFAGVRYERLERSGSGTSSQGITQGVSNLLDAAIAEIQGDPPPVPFPDAPGQFFPSIESATQETYSLRAGVTAFVPFAENATAFFNGMVHGSYQPGFTAQSVFPDVNGPGQDLAITTRNPSEFSLGPDFAVGAQITVAENIALDLRYRAVAFFPLSGANSFSDARINHGVNIGFSFRL
ncbi:MAG: hypothetical protein AAGH53_03715 [Pseudomonadota bacterium]